MQETWFHPCVGKILWRRKWQPTPVFLPGESHGHGITKSRTRLSDFIFLPIITPSSMIMQANLFFSRFLTLITSAKSLLSCKVTYHRHWGRIWGSLKCLLQRCIQVSQFSPSVVSWLFVTPWTAARQASLSSTNSQSFQTQVHQVGNAIQPAHPLLSPSPPASNFSQHQGPFKWVSSSRQVAKVLEFQIQHESFQWTPRTDLL